VVFLCHHVRCFYTCLSTWIYFTFQISSTRVWIVVAGRSLDTVAFSPLTVTTNTRTSTTTNSTTTMRRGMLHAGALVLYGSCSSSAFSPSDILLQRNVRLLHSQHVQKPVWSSQLHLVPEQGNQLVAAYTAALSKYEEEHRLDGEGVEDVAMNDDDESPRWVGNPTTPADDSSTSSRASRNFVQRAFSLPSLGSSNNNKKLKTSSSTSSSSTENGDQHDVVLFPLVGFTFCRNGNQVVPLPTQSNVSCRLPRRSDVHQEEVYGWYSPVCRLNMYAANDEEYCNSPKPQTSSNVTP
jgi:hypothetical protein